MKIGGASNIPKQGAINQETFIALEPGDRLAIISGRSPLGVSFRENICSGYLEQFQDFSPPLSRSCPTATSELWNRNLAGDSSCVSFAAGVDTCETPLTGFPGNLSSQCLLFAQNDLTYNGCVAIHKNDFSFSQIDGDSMRAKIARHGTMEVGLYASTMQTARLLIPSLTDAAIYQACERARCRRKRKH